MWTDYCQNCKVDVLVMTEPFWTEEHEYDFKRINTFLYRLALVRTVILPLFVAAVWGLYALFGQYDFFMLVVFAMYGLLMGVFWLTASSQVRQVSLDCQELFKQFIECGLMFDTRNVPAFLGLPIFVILNCFVLGLGSEAMRPFYWLSLVIASLYSFMHVWMISFEPTPYWFDERLEKHI